MMRYSFACSLLIAAPWLAFAAESAWRDLLAGKPSEVWKTKTDDWSQVETLKVDDKSPRKLAFAGKGGIWVNGEKGRAADLVTRDSFTDVELTMDFLIPKGSNSGVKFHAVYEIQIHDTFGSKDLSGDTCGGIYPRAELKPKYHHIDQGIAPKVNACKPPGEWQTLQVIFLSPRIDKVGKKTANAKVVRATLNGQLIHENQELLTPTGNNWSKKELPAGPLMLQGDHGPVAFRNVRVREYKPAR